MVKRLRHLRFLHIFLNCSSRRGIGLDSLCQSRAVLTVSAASSLGLGMVLLFNFPWWIRWKCCHSTVVLIFNSKSAQGTNPTRNPPPPPNPGIEFFDKFPLFPAFYLAVLPWPGYPSNVLPFWTHWPPPWPPLLLPWPLGPWPSFMAFSVPHTLNCSSHPCPSHLLFLSLPCFDSSSYFTWNASSLERLLSYTLKPLHLSQLVRGYSWRLFYAGISSDCVCLCAQLLGILSHRVDCSSVRLVPVMHSHCS